MSIANNKLEIDDTVRITSPAAFLTGTEERSYTVKEIPGNQVMSVRHWTLLGDTQGSLIVTTEALVMEILN